METKTTELKNPMEERTKEKNPIVKAEPIVKKTEVKKGNDKQKSKPSYTVYVGRLSYPKDFHDKIVKPFAKKKGITIAALYRIALENYCKKS